jgi:hypothetical protein
MVQSFMVSPGVNTTEYDLTNIIPSVSSTDGALAGVFHWGPINEIVQLGSANNLLQSFGKPSNFNAETWFTASDFLGYDGNLHLVRAADIGGNTVHVSDAAAAIGAANAIIGTTNTTGIAVGMVLFYSNTTSLVTDPRVAPTVLAVNTSTITLSAPASTTVTGANLVFRTNCTYAAVAQENIQDNISWNLQLVPNEASYLVQDGTFDPSVRYIARFGGSIGNSLYISQCDTAAQFSSNVALVANALINATATSITATTGSSNLAVVITPANLSTGGAAANAVAGAAFADISINDLIQVGNS